MMYACMYVCTYGGRLLFKYITCIVCLYEESDAYGEFSNFAIYPIIIHNVIWHTSEHYFQAMACPHDPDYQENENS